MAQEGLASVEQRQKAHMPQEDARLLPKDPATEDHYAPWSFTVQLEALMTSFQTVETRYGAASQGTAWSPLLGCTTTIWSSSVSCQHDGREDMLILFSHVRAKVALAACQRLDRSLLITHECE